MFEARKATGSSLSQTHKVCSSLELYISFVVYEMLLLIRLTSTSERYCKCPWTQSFWLSSWTIEFKCRDRDPCQGVANLKVAHWSPHASSWKCVWVMSSILANLDTEEGKRNAIRGKMSFCCRQGCAVSAPKIQIRNAHIQVSSHTTDAAGTRTGAIRSKKTNQ